MRILRSLVSIFLVTTLIYTIIYTLVPRKLIFKQDTNYNKIATTADKRDNYENTVFERMGYIEYYDTKELQEKASSIDSSVTVDANDTNKAIYENISNNLVTVGLWVNSQRAVNSMQHVKFLFLNVSSTSMRTCLILTIQIKFKIQKIQTWSDIYVLKMTLLSAGL